MGKYFQLTDDANALQKWNEIEYINIDRRILQKTVYPDNKNKEAFIRWWELLCKYSHATRASGQAAWEYDELQKEIHINFSFIYMLFVMLYHFMNRFLQTPYFTSYLERICRDMPDQKGQPDIARCRRELSNLVKAVTAQCSIECRKVLRYYAAAWRLQPPNSGR